MKTFLEKIEGDKVIWVIVIILSVISLLAVYSASDEQAFRLKGGNTEFYVLRQLIILATGFFIMYSIHLLNYTFFSRISQIMLVLSILLLVLTAIYGTGKGVNRYLAIPFIGLSFQTSDIAKIGLILYLSRALTLKQKLLNDFKSVRYTVILPIFLMILLIFKEDNSTAAIIFSIGVLMMFFGGVSLKIIAKVLTVTIIAALIYGYVKPSDSRAGTLVNRFKAWAGYSDVIYEDRINLDRAIALGGITGVKPGNSIQKYQLSESHSDYIYAIIIEEYGLLGGLTLLLLYLILVYRGIGIAYKAPSMYSSFLALGVTLILLTQSFVHMGVTAGVFPLTGQTLPLISMGGTSIWISFISLGILLSVSRTIYKTEANTYAQKCV